MTKQLTLEDVFNDPLKAKKYLLETYGMGTTVRVVGDSAFIDMSTLDSGMKLFEIATGNGYTCTLSSTGLNNVVLRIRA